MKSVVFIASIALCAVFWGSSASAHGGGTDAQGCHKESKTGTRHCHNSGSKTKTQADKNNGSSHQRSYANCSAVRAAGKAPLRRGQVGYARHLDRDNDGIACE